MKFHHVLFPVLMLTASTVLMDKLWAQTPPVEPRRTAAPDWLAVRRGMSGNRSYQAALTALKKGLYGQARVHLKKTLSSKKLKTEQEEVLKSLMGEILVRDGKPAEALEYLEGLPAGAASPYWRGMALLKLGRFSHAVPCLLEIDANDADYGIPSRMALLSIAWRTGNEGLLASSLDALMKSEKQEAVARAALAHAEWLLNQGKTEGVKELLEKAEKESRSASSLKGIALYGELLGIRLAALTGEWNSALEKCREMAERKGVPALIRDSARLEQATIYKMKETAPAAQDVSQEISDDTEDTGGQEEETLLHLIASSPESPLLAEAFRRLSEADAFSDPQARGKLSEWGKNAHAARAPMALLYLARLFKGKGELDEALSCVQICVTKYAKSNSAQELIQEGVEWLVEANRPGEAQELLKHVSAPTQRSLFEKGILFWKANEMDAARRAFAAALRLSDEAMYPATAKNLCLAALCTKEKDSVDDLLKRTENEPAMHAALLYEKARCMAYDRDMIPALREIVKLYPEMPEALYARMDLAGIFLSEAPQSAAKELDAIDAARTKDWSSEEKLRLAFLKIETAEGMRDAGETWTSPESLSREALGQSFPEAARSKLFIKLGSILFHEEKYADALKEMEQFENLFPRSPLIGAAQYLAAQSAENLQTPDGFRQALLLYRECAQGKSEFAVPAVIAEAAVSIRLNRTKEAEELLDRLMASPSLRVEDRAWALSLKAETREVSAAAAQGNGLLNEARDCCDQILGLKDLSPSWRFRTLIQRARLFEKMENFDKALDDYQEILADAAPSSPKRSDWYWYNTAGFSAVSLYEKKGDYSAAVALAEDLSSKPSNPREKDAADWARRLKLEHFVWEARPEEEPRRISP